MRYFLLAYITVIIYIIIYIHRNTVQSYFTLYCHNPTAFYFTLPFFLSYSHVTSYHLILLFISHD